MAIEAFTSSVPEMLGMMRQSIDRCFHSSEEELVTLVAERLTLLYRNLQWDALEEHSQWIHSARIESIRLQMKQEVDCLTQKLDQEVSRRESSLRVKQNSFQEVQSQRCVAQPLINALGSAQELAQQRLKELRDYFDQYKSEEFLVKMDSCHYLGSMEGTKQKVRAKLAAFEQDVPRRERNLTAMIPVVAQIQRRLQKTLIWT
jgi:hypothetical protein